MGLIKRDHTSSRNGQGNDKFMHISKHDDYESFSGCPRCGGAVFEAERLIGFRSIEKLERDFGLIRSLIIEDLDHHVRVAKTDNEAMLQEQGSVQSNERAIAIA